MARGTEVIRRDLAAARRLATAARRTSKTLGDPYCVGVSSRLSGHVLLLGGHARKALPHYEAAMEAFRDLEVERAATSVAMLQALAYVGDYARGFAIGREAISTFLGLGDAARAARVRVNLGNAYHRLDQIAEARAEFEAAIPILAEANLVADLTIAMRNYGVVLMAAGEHEAADRMYGVARQAFETTDQRSLMLEVDLNRAYLLGRQGKVRDALVAYRALRQDLPDDLGFEVGHGFLDEAELMLDAGLWTDASDAAVRAANVFQDLDARFEIGKARLLQALALLRRNRLEEARDRLRDARRYLRREPSSDWQARQTLAECELARRQGRAAQAYRTLDRAIEREMPAERKREFDRHRFDLAIDRGDRREICRLASAAPPALRAKAARVQGDAEAAEAHAQAAVIAYDRRQSQLTAVRLRQGSTTAQEADLRESFRCLRSVEERFLVVQRIKQHALAELAAASRDLPPPASVTDTATHDPGQEEAIVSALREERRIREGAGSRAVQVPTVPERTRLVEFFADEGRLRAFQIGSSRIEEFDLCPLEGILQWARRLRFQLGRERNGPGEGVLRMLQDLGKVLAPLLSDGFERLVIGREVQLAGLPWHAVMRGPEPLALCAEVAYTPSVSVWDAVRHRDAAQPGPPVVLGHADSRAPAILNELEKISQRLGTDPAMSGRPSASLEEAGLIHIAAHGVVREDQPLFSALRLGDQEMAPADILRLRLRARLAVLSGCSTGISVPGESHDAEGFIEALLANGCSAVLATLWDVSDEATAEWMARFYDRLSGTTIAEAYRQTMREFCADHPHPALWAPFALFGDAWQKPVCLGGVAVPEKI